MVTAAHPTHCWPTTAAGPVTSTWVSWASPTGGRTWPSPPGARPETTGQAGKLPCLRPTAWLLTPTARVTTGCCGTSAHDQHDCGPAGPSSRVRSPAAKLAPADLAPLVRLP